MKEKPFVLDESDDITKKLLELLCCVTEEFIESIRTEENTLSPLEYEALYNAFMGYLHHALEVLLGSLKTEPAKVILLNNICSNFGTILRSLSEEINKKNVHH